MDEFRIERNERAKKNEVDRKVLKAVSFMLASVGCWLSPSPSMDMGYKLYDGTQLRLGLVIIDEVDVRAHLYISFVYFLVSQCVFYL